jgi:hypothetical protein
MAEIKNSSPFYVAADHGAPWKDDSSLGLIGQMPKKVIHFSASRLPRS